MEKAIDIQAMMGDEFEASLASPEKL